MTQILEASMLICFGCSWPISVYKNFKARTARSTSLQFILLILLGYVAGIAAKIYSHTINYVLIVYAFNFVAVAANLVVYFVNRRYDRLREAEATAEQSREMEAEQPAPVTDPDILCEMERYERMNQTAEENGTVLFGANYFHELAAGELAQSVGMEEAVYNRSIEKLSVENACGALEQCVLQLHPARVFINIGDEDVRNAALNLDRFIEQYQWMLYRLHSRSKAKMYIVSVISNLAAAERMNDRLRGLAEETGCEYVDAREILDSGEPELRLFELIHFHARSHAITFGEAMSHRC